MTHDTFTGTRSALVFAHFEIVLTLRHFLSHLVEGFAQILIGGN